MGTSAAADKLGVVDKPEVVGVAAAAGILAVQAADIPEAVGIPVVQAVGIPVADKPAVQAAVVPDCCSFHPFQIFLNLVIIELV